MLAETCINYSRVWSKFFFSYFKGRLPAIYPRFSLNCLLTFSFLQSQKYSITCVAFLQPGGSKLKRDWERWKTTWSWVVPSLPSSGSDEDVLILSRSGGQICHFERKVLNYSITQWLLVYVYFSPFRKTNNPFCTLVARGHIPCPYFVLFIWYGKS